MVMNKEIKDYKEYWFVMSLLHSMSLNKIVVFVDEMTYNNKSTPEYLRTKTINNIIVNRTSQKISHSLIAATTFTEVILFRVFETTINSESFGSFLIALINYYRGKAIDLNDVVIVLDNAPIHKAHKITALEGFIHLLWLPPYSPHLNFIERVFSLWKAHIKKKTYETIGKNLDDIVGQALELIRSDSWCKKRIEQLEAYNTSINTPPCQQE